MTIKLLADEFAIVKTSDFSGVNWASDFLFLAKTDQENSIVCPKASIPGNCLEVSAGWRAMRFEGQLDFSLTGILATISTVLANASVSIFAISTYNTDYILIKSESLEKAVAALRQAGYTMADQSGDAVLVRRLAPGDELTVSQLIGRNFREINSRDYPAAEMERLAAFYSPEKILDLAFQGHFYVACADGTVIGCGLANLPDPGGDCRLQVIFVDPLWHGCQIGCLIVESLERDCIGCQGRRAVLDASITAVSFYEKLNYRHAGGVPVLDEHGLYRMEKALG